MRSSFLITRFCIYPLFVFFYTISVLMPMHVSRSIEKRSAQNRPETTRPTKGESTIKMLKKKRNTSRGRKQRGRKPPVRIRAKLKAKHPV
jgi:hypothetical protein